MFMTAFGGIAEAAELTARRFQQEHFEAKQFQSVASNLNIYLPPRSAKRSPANELCQNQQQKGRGFLI